MEGRGQRGRGELIGVLGVLLVGILDTFSIYFGCHGFTRSHSFEEYV